MATVTITRQELHRWSQYIDADALGDVLEKYVRAGWVVEDPLTGNSLITDPSATSGRHLIGKLLVSSRRRGWRNALTRSNDARRAAEHESDRALLGTCDVEADMMRQVDIVAVRDALARLESAHAELLVAIYFNELSYEELESLRLSTNSALRKQAQRAREQLRTRIDDRSVGDGEP